MSRRRVDADAAFAADEPFRLIDRGGGEYTFQGDLLFSTVNDALRSSSRLFARRGSCRFDFAEIGRADSAGVALLVEWAKRARKKETRLRYSHLPEHLMAIIRVVGVQDLLPIESLR